MNRSSLPKLQQRILELLAAVQFATPHQLADLCGVQPPAISKATSTLYELGLIDGSLFSRPMIWNLAPAGGNLLGAPLAAGRRHASWSVMAHACHCNALAEQLRESYKGFRFLSRLQLLKRGFNPAHGEHGAIDDSGISYFVLLDDYMMPSHRISRSWTRRHTPNRKYWPDYTGGKFCETVQAFLVATTDEKHAKRHEKWILKEGLPADVIYIKPLWLI